MKWSEGVFSYVFIVYYTLGALINILKGVNCSCITKLMGGSLCLPIFLCHLDILSSFHFIPRDINRISLSFTLSLYRFGKINLWCQLSPPADTKLMVSSWKNVLALTRALWKSVSFRCSSYERLWSHIITVVTTALNYSVTFSVLILYICSFLLLWMRT